MDKELGGCLFQRGHLGDEHRLARQLAAPHLQYNKCGVDTVALRRYVVPALLVEVLHLLFCHQLGHCCYKITALRRLLVVQLLGILLHLPLEFCNKSLGIAGQQRLNLAHIDAVFLLVCFLAAGSQTASDMVVEAWCLSGLKLSFALAQWELLLHKLKIFFQHFHAWIRAEV